MVRPNTFNFRERACQELKTHVVTTKEQGQNSKSIRFPWRRFILSLEKLILSLIDTRLQEDWNILMCASGPLMKWSYC
jgi:hypothetical protein